MSRSHQHRHSAGNSDTRRRAVAVAAVIAAVATGAATIDAVASAGGGGSTAAGYEASTAQRAASIGRTEPITIPAAYASGGLRNPFKPLLTAPPPAQPATSQASTPSPTPTSAPTPVVIVMPTPTTNPAPTTNPTPTATVTATPSPTGLPTAGQPVTLTLVSVDGTAVTVNATVTIGKVTTPYDNLKPGQVFGTYFKLVSILSTDPADPPVMYGADFQYGDQFAQLAVGDSSQFG